jgi:hypothetical protein
VKRVGDDRGAILLIAVFFAVFAVAMLYSLIGTAQAIAFREGLQDHADKAALSSAILHARSMNLIVLLNLVMAGLLTVLVALKLVEGLAMLGMLVAAGLAWFTSGASLGWIPPLESVRNTVHSTYDSTRDPVYEALEALHTLADTVRDAAPLVASAASLSDPSATDLRGFASSSRPDEGLPVVDDSFDKLCEKSGELAVGLGMAPFASIVPVDQLPLKDAAGAMTGQLSDWFCGDSSGGPPSYTQTAKKSYPESDDDLACRSGQASEAACAERKAFWAAAEPDETGSCRAGEDCSATGPYETSVALARVQCEPSKTFKPSQLFYQLRHGYADYEWNGIAWELAERRYDTPERVDSEKRRGLPCGGEELKPVVAVGYERVVRTSDDVSEVDPVCSTEVPPLALPGEKHTKGETRTVEFDEVTHILGCVVSVPQTVDFSDDDESGGSGGDPKSPKTVPSDLSLGSEAFQIRSFVDRDTSALDAERVVRLALWADKSPHDPLAGLQKFSNKGFAQAEYFYDGTEGHDAWMWNMNWRARLVRFRLPSEAAELGVLGGLCEQTGAGCAGLLPKLRELESVIAH